MLTNKQCLYTMTNAYASENHYFLPIIFTHI